MEKIVSRDEIYEITTAVREQAFEKLVKAINEEISKAANSGRLKVKWDVKDHLDFLWDDGITDRLEQLLQEAGYDVTFSYENLFSSYTGCTIKWAEKEPEAEEDQEEPIVEEPVKRQWWRKNK